MNIIGQSHFTDTEDAASRIVAWTRENGGGTFTRTGYAVAPRNVWAVGGKEPGRVLSEEQTTVTLYGPALRSTIAPVTEFIQQTPYTDGGTFIGTWVDEGRLYLDVVDLIEDTASAIAIAAERGEKAIYNLGTGETYTLGI